MAKVDMYVMLTGGSTFTMVETVTLSPTDAGSDTSGVASTFYKVVAGRFVSVRSVLVAAVDRYAHDSVHTITYYSIDNAGNQEADKTATVRIDTVVPVSSASGPKIGRASCRERVSFTASDATSR